MDYGAIAAGAAGTAYGVGSIFTAHHDSRANRHLADRQFKAQREDNYNATQIRVADALKAGINPLAALGVSSNVSPTIHAGGSSGASDGFAQAGAGMSKMLQGLFEKKAVDDIKYTKESQDLDLESQRLHNQILQKQLATTGTPGVDEEQPKMMGQDLLFKPVYDLQGRPRLVVNQNVMEGDADNPGYMSSIMATIAAGIKDGQIDPVSGRIKSDQMRMMLDDMYFNMTGHHMMNLEELYISPSEAAAAASYMARGVS